MDASGTRGKRGALIVVEGLDRAGKSSQCEFLRSFLEKIGHTVKHIRFPDRTTSIGKMINSYLQGQSQFDDHSIHLLFSANRWELAQSIESDIADGTTVIIDRYSYSGAVYSAAKNNPSLSLEWAWLPEIGLPKPDLCFFLSISPEAAAKRGGFGAERYENETMQARVRELFTTVFDLQRDSNIQVIDAGKSFEEVSQDMSKIVTEAIARVDTASPLGKLTSIS
ncbi:bifunctional thymidylate/uridylate kinase [Aspergillus stella-maris]|uniref:bifunctional thymidylate/uridylate kinase n=1 Tax=Aspergillus stella-maris TaxID=1810926 RepID=UPI003CCD6994